MSVAPGHSFNSGAGLLVASGLPAICHDSKIAFNEVTFGYVPHAGSTYYASRLPGDFGTFLLLTGWPVTGKDAIKLGMADSLIEVPETYEHEIIDVILALDPTSMPNSMRAMGAENFGIDRDRPAETAALKRAMSI
jgi:enoyl-CoA hydratase/carnithine racemase